MEDLFTVYSQIYSETNTVDPQHARNFINNIKSDNISNKILLELAYSFYNLGYENGKKNN